MFSSLLNIHTLAVTNFISLTLILLIIFSYIKQLYYTSSLNDLLYTFAQGSSFLKEGKNKK